MVLTNEQTKWLNWLNCINDCDFPGCKQTRHEPETSWTIVCQPSGTVISLETVDQVSFFLFLFIHCSVHSLQKPLKSHWCCLQENKLHYKNKTTLVFFQAFAVGENQTLTLTNSACARNGNFLSALPLKPLLFLEMKRKTKRKPLAVPAPAGTWCQD